jgi:ribosomal protein S18 acetylase RimI-like enzyme
MEIVRASEADAEVLERDFWFPLAKEIEEYHEINELEESAEEDAVEKFEERLAKEDFLYFFIESEGEKVGYIGLKQGETPSRKMEKFLAVKELFVKEGFRGQGYGTRLLEKAEEVAEERGKDYLMVSAEWENEGARKLYERMGFKEKKVKYVKTLKG